MALIHRATLDPSKLDLLRAWLPSRPWFPAGAEVEPLGAYRFDDPDGEVGLEAFLLRAGDVVLHVPLTYRASAPDVPDEHRLGTTEHSVLGTRWVTDGCADPVWVRELVRTVLTGGAQAVEEVETDGVLVPRDPSATARGSGAPGTPVPDVTDVVVEDGPDSTRVVAGAAGVSVARVVGTAPPATRTLTATWTGGSAVVAAVDVPG
ncbi:hypothetical protein GCM10028777_34610 [Angustibacter speluncae]